MNVQRIAGVQCVLPRDVAQIVANYNPLSIREKVLFFATRHFRTVADRKSMRVCSCSHSSVYIRNTKLNRKHGNHPPVVFEIGNCVRRYDSLTLGEFIAYLEDCAQMDFHSEWPLGKEFRGMLADWLAQIG